MGVCINLTVKQAVDCLDQSGIVFLFAPLYHPALKHVKLARQAYGKKTFYNFLGPLLNPFGAKFQLIGLSDFSYSDMMGQALLETGSKQVILVQGDQRLDEVSISGPTRYKEFSSTVAPTEQIYSPLEFGYDLYDLASIAGGNAKHNAQIILDILSNKAPIAHLRCVTYNVAFALMARGKVSNIKSGIKLAESALFSGLAKEKLESFIRISNGYGDRL